MPPDRRLDQLEPLMADSLQKIDRLIEGQGKILELAINTKTDLDEFKKEVRADLSGVKTDINEFKKEVRADLNGVKTDINGVKRTVELTAAGLADLTVSNQKQFDEIKIGQQELKNSQEELKAGQKALTTSYESIMQYLKEKLP